MPEHSRQSTPGLGIREAVSSDRAAIHALLFAAFGTVDGDEIAALVDALMVDPTAEPVLSLVATKDKRVVGHILFSAVRVGEPPGLVRSAILAPLAVDPGFQRLGIGRRLIEQGLDRLREQGVALVFVLGHAGYYPRHGFQPAGVHGFRAPYPIPPEHENAWMVQELTPGTIGRVAGAVQCSEALDEERYWVE